MVVMLVDKFCNHFTSICGFVFDIWAEWHMLILSPIFLLFLIPVVVLIFLYGTALFLYIYRHRRRQIYDAYASNFWEGARIAVAAFYDAQATLWHGRPIFNFCIFLLNKNVNKTILSSTFFIYVH